MGVVDLNFKAAASPAVTDVELSELLSAAGAPAASNAELRGGSETILCVEDDDVVRGHVVGRLESLGYKVIPAANAAEALELGFDAVLLNTAVAKADHPVNMAHAFRLAVEAGRAGFEAGLMGARDFASPSTPVVGTPFWHAVS